MSQVLAASGLVCLLLAVLGPTPRHADAQDTATPRPDVFRSSASSLVAQAFLDRDALLPVPDLFRFIALEGSGTYETSNQTARASLFFPGNGVVSGPGLVCGTFGREFPPEFKPIFDACTGFQFPLSVRADSLQPDSSSTGATQLGSPGDPVSGEAIRAVAHAADDAATSDAAMSSLRVVGLPGIGPLDTVLPLEDVPDLDDTVLTIESATSRTSQRIDETGTLVLRAKSTLSGIRLIGGLVEIGSLQSVASVTDDGRGAVTHDTELEIGGVTVGGIPARITDNGLEIGSTSGALGPLADQLTQLVSGLGIKVTMLEVGEGVDEEGSAFARVGGLLVEFELDVRGLPILPGPIGDIDPNGLYQGSIALAQAGVTGQAAHIDVPEFVPAPVPDVGGVPPIITPPDSFNPDVTTEVPPTTSPPPEQDDELAAPENSQELIRVSAFEHLIEGRLRLVYVAFALVTLAVCVAPRFAFPARLPGAAP